LVKGFGARDGSERENCGMRRGNPEQDHPDRKNKSFGV
jgi:hypothetical protein